MAYDPSMYEARRRGYTENYAAQAAANQYSRTLSQQRGARQRQDALRQYERAQPQLVRAYSQRNLVSPNVRSGIFSRAMQEFAGERARGLSDFDMAQAEQMRGLIWRMLVCYSSTVRCWGIWNQIRLERLQMLPVSCLHLEQEQCNGCSSL